MTLMSKIDEDGFIVANFVLSEFPAQEHVAFASPTEECQPGFVWRRVSGEWVQHEDRRGRMFFDPSSTEGVVTKIALTGLLEEPPSGWLPYGDEQRIRDAREMVWDAIRAERQKRLESSDWTDTLSAASRLGETLYQEWQAYRQALRDITEQTDPDMLVWPIEPGSANKVAPLVYQLTEGNQ
jgi:hypothetical protein